MSPDYGIITGDINNGMPRVAVNNRGYGQPKQEIDMASISPKLSGAKTSIYALVDPIDKSIRYVGKSDNPKNRYKQHIKDVSTNRDKIDWIAGLRATGKKPKLEILERVPVELWAYAERHWIDLGKQNNWPLTNMSGGIGDDEYDEIMWYYLPDDTAWDKYCLLSTLEKQWILQTLACEMIGHSRLYLKVTGRKYSPESEHNHGVYIATMLVNMNDKQRNEMHNLIDQRSNEWITAINNRPLRD